MRKTGRKKHSGSEWGRLAQFPKTEEKEESFIMELNMFPHTKFFVFEDVKKEGKAADDKEEKAEVETDEISADQIPF